MPSLPWSQSESEGSLSLLNQSLAAKEGHYHDSDYGVLSSKQGEQTKESAFDYGQRGARIDAVEDLLVVSPYTDRAHLLDLTILNQAQILLAHALTVLSPATAAYATSAYIASFNWVEVFNFLATTVKAANYPWKEQVFYIVVFRSQVPPTTDRSHLGALDKRAHAEAMQTNGLLKYWFGVPDHDGRNLATCIWRRRSDAHTGSSGDGHKAAMRATVQMYTEWHVQRLKLMVGNNVECWDIVPWTD
ncbi:MAG: hypothetical protein L6R37_002675 [Teloschistes peruensis]|nr:MAG: hypothetical protein L6R37_002675 [Teloschistes peruensis]